MFYISSRAGTKVAFINSRAPKDCPTADLKEQIENKKLQGSRNDGGTSVTGGNSSHAVIGRENHIVLSEHEQQRFEQVCLEHIWAAVGMHVICNASGSEADARSAATSVRDLVNVAPAYRACWERVKPIVLSQGFRTFISIVDSQLPYKDSPRPAFREDPSARDAGMHGAPQRGTHPRTDERGELAAERVLAIDTRDRKERSSPPIESRADTIHQSASDASKTSTRDSRRALPRGKLRVLEGKFAGRELELKRVLTEFGQRGKHQVALLRQKNGYSIVTITDPQPDAAPRVNGTPIGSRARILKDNDIVQIAGIKARFMLT